MMNLLAGLRLVSALIERTPRQAPHYLLILTCLSAGCATWRVETASPRSLIVDEQPRSVRILLKDSTEVLIANPVIRSDSIAGVVRIQAGIGGGPLQDLTVAVALADVASASVAVVDTRKAVLLLVPVGLALGIVILLAS